MDLLGQQQLKIGSVRIFSIDYTDWLLNNETVVSAFAEVSPITAIPLVADAQPLSDGKFVSIEISGGEADTSYVVQVTATTTIDNSPDPNGSQTRIDCFGVNMVEDCVA